MILIISLGSWMLLIIVAAAIALYKAGKDMED